MGTIKRCGLFGLSSILLSTGLSVLLYAPSYASSVYDGTYQTVDELLVGSDGIYRDDTNSWFTKVTDIQAWKDNGYNSSFIDAKLASMANKQRWGISQAINSDEAETKNYIFYWTEDTSLSLSWIGGSMVFAGSTGGTVHAVWYSYSPTISKYIVTDAGSSTAASAFPVSYSDGTFKNLFIYTDYFNYPDGYSSTEIKLEVTNTVDLTDELSFTAEVNDKIITLWNTTPSPPLTSADRCKFTLYDSTGSGDVLWDTEYASFCSQVHTVDIQKILNGSYGTYTIMLSVQRDTNSDGMPDVDVGYFQKDVVVDGSTYSMTAGYTFVDKSTDYEDCTTFGWDVAQRLTCEIGNATKKVTDFITGLFIPNRLLIQQKQEEFMTDMRSHIPAVLQTYTWLSVDLVTALAGGDEVVCNHSFGYFFGSEFVFNQCALEQKFPQIWAVVALTIRATVAFALLMLVYKKMKIIIYGERFHDKGAF